MASIALTVCLSGFFFVDGSVEGGFRMTDRAVGPVVLGRS
jgi:hypothetical protein